jgi:hypothetical protein
MDVDMKKMDDNMPLDDKGISNSSSGRDRDRDRDRERDREFDRDKDRDRERDPRDHNYDRERERRDRDKEREHRDRERRDPGQFTAFFFSFMSGMDSYLYLGRSRRSGAGDHWEPDRRAGDVSHFLVVDVVHIC